MKIGVFLRLDSRDRPDSRCESPGHLCLLRIGPALSRIDSVIVQARTAVEAKASAAQPSTCSSNRGWLSQEEPPVANPRRIFPKEGEPSI